VIRGVQSSAETMRAMITRQEVVARNLANLLTPGYKQETALLKGFAVPVSRLESRVGVEGVRAALSARSAIGDVGVGTGIDGISVDFRQGPLQETGRPLDVALVGDGFLRVRTPEGEFLSRGGPLRLDADRRLVTEDGYPVLGPTGDVTLPDGVVSVERDGTILVDRQPVATISVVEYPPGTRVAKVGDGLFTPEDPLSAQQVANPLTQVRGGYLEASNVDETAAMTELVQSLRAYQASQRMLQAQDDLLGKAINEVGRV